MANYNGYLYAIKPSTGEIIRHDSITESLSIVSDGTEVPLFGVFAKNGSDEKLYLGLGFPRGAKSQIEFDPLFTSISTYKYIVMRDDSAKLKCYLESGGAEALVYEDESFNSSKAEVVCTLGVALPQSITLNSSMQNFGFRLLIQENGYVYMSGLKIRLVSKNGHNYPTIDVADGSDMTIQSYPREINVKSTISDLVSSIDELTTKVDQVSSDTLTKYCSR